MKKLNIFYGHSGGVTSVINVTAYGLIKEAQNNSNINNIFIGKNGILGIINEELIDISKINNNDIELLKYTPASAFGSCRYKLPDNLDDKIYKRILEIMKYYKINIFFYNGGGDSQDTVQKMFYFSKKYKYDLQVIGIPKTIDNDLPITDNSPGFGSTAKYIATSVKEVSLDIKSMYKTSTKIFILEVMGRNTGWIAASSALANNNRADGPHIILFPEVPFNKENFLRSVKKFIEKYNFCIVIVSEGIKLKNYLYNDNISKDSFGHEQLGGVSQKISNIISQELKIKNYCAVLGHLQRSARHISSKVDIEQAYKLGKKSIEYALSNKTNIMLNIKRISNIPYKWDIHYSNIKKVANIEKKLPRDFISSDQYYITEKCRLYLKPLINGEYFPNYNDGIPEYLNFNKNKYLIKKSFKKYTA